MIKNRLFFIIIVVYVSVQSLSAKVDEKNIQRGVELTLNMRFEQAIALFDSIIQEYPQDPAGYFLKSAVYFWMYTQDVRMADVGNLFETISKKGIDVAETRLEENGNDLDAKFYLGAIYGNLGRYYIMNSSWLKAYWYGSEGKDLLEEIVESHPDYYNAYLGLGIYHYYADILPGVIKVLSYILGIKGDKQKGLRELKLAINKGTFVKSEAQFFLAMTYMYFEYNYLKARNLWAELGKGHPDNTFFILSQARCEMYMNNYLTALRLYKKVLKKKDDRLKFALNRAHYFAGEIYFKMNNFHQAAYHYEQAVKNIPPKNKKRHWIYVSGKLHLGETYEILGFRDKAVKCYKQVSEGDQTFAYREAQRRLKRPMDEFDKQLVYARNYRQLQKLDSALVILNRLKKDINNEKNKDRKGEFLYQLGLVYLRKGQAKKAIDLFKELLAEKPQSPVWLLPRTHYQIGNAYLRLGQKEAALAHYERAMDSDDPRFKIQVKRAMDKL